MYDLAVMIHVTYFIRTAPNLYHVLEIQLSAVLPHIGQRPLGTFRLFEWCWHLKVQVCLEVKSSLIVSKGSSPLLRGFSWAPVYLLLFRLRYVSCLFLTVDMSGIPGCRRGYPAGRDPDVGTRPWLEVALVLEEWMCHPGRCTS